VRRPTTSYFIPDVAVVPVALGQHLRDKPGVLEVYEEPLPLVVEIWSKSPASTTSRPSWRPTKPAATPRSGASTPTSGR
jgi:hypothetical protein